MGRRGLRLSEETKRTLVEHPWPGTVRELQNCLERAAILCDGNEIQPAHLRLGGTADSGPTLGDVMDLTGTLEEVTARASARAEQEAIRLALKHAENDNAAAAERLGISVSALRRRIKALDPGD
jgi:DNA-binding NtrC family response regulator